MELLDQYCDGRYVYHDPLAGDLDKNGEKTFVRRLRSAFPNLKIQVERCIMENDLVCTQWHATGTHKGEFIGVPASDRKMDLRGIDLARAKDGKLVEVWTYLDTLGLMQQLGVVPRLDTAAARQPEVRPS